METKDSPFGYRIDTRIRDKYHEGYKRSDSEVTHLIIHGTAGGNSAESNLKWMLSGGYLGNGKYRSYQYQKGVSLFQYIIDRDGKIIELLNPHNFVYASSTGGDSLKQIGFDRHCIQVELTNPNRENKGHYTIMQYHALVFLYGFLKERFENLNKIYGHGAIKKEKTGGYKVCPGSGFDWDRFDFMLFDMLKITTQLKDEYILEVL